MIDHGVGVTVATTHEIKRIDLDYFGADEHRLGRVLGRRLARPWELLKRQSRWVCRFYLGDAICPVGGPALGEVERRRRLLTAGNVAICDFDDNIRAGP